MAGPAPDTGRGGRDAEAVTTFLIVLAIFNTGMETGQNIHTVVHVAKAIHHHSTRPVYRHVLKPIAKAVR